MNEAFDPSLWLMPGWKENEVKGLLAPNCLKPHLLVPGRPPTFLLGSSKVKVRNLHNVHTPGRLTQDSPTLPTPHTSHAAPPDSEVWGL